MFTSIERAELYVSTPYEFLIIQLFRERLSGKALWVVFEFTVLQRNLQEWHQRPWTCLRLLKGSNKNKFDSYSVRNSVLNISHITFRDCRVHIFSDNLSRNSCIQIQPRLKAKLIFINFLFKSNNKLFVIQKSVNFRAHPCEF